MGVSISLEQFAAKLTTYQDRQSKTQLQQFERSKRRFYTALIKASESATGGSRRLDRIGKATGFEAREGARLGFVIRDMRGSLVVPGQSGPAERAIEIKKVGPWQIVDDSVNSGPTDPHEIAPDPIRNKRPLPPGTKYKPTLRQVGGGYIPGTVQHPGSNRFPHWGKAIRSVRQQHIDLSRADFYRIGREVFP